ncbi:MAG TPA: exopolysaccharide biosynthesis protein [Chakrabartia sp.]|nr:exopolysaccharide biosynthesis protein [Chakrabartia sp.]
MSPPVYTQPRTVRADVDIALLKESGFVVPGMPPSVLSEEFRMIKRQVLLQAFGNQNLPALEKGRQILVCSAQPNEGKSFSSVNLALSMVSETDLEVLLIDADVAKPEVLSMLGLPAGPGLMDALADPSIDPESLVMHTNIPGLSVLPAGRQSNNDTELLASARTCGLIDKLSAANPRRVVIFDSAPALAASPASVLAMHVGQIVLVVRADVTTESELREALSMLDGGARIQLLLNAVTFSGSNRKFGSYYGLGEK